MDIQGSRNPEGKYVRLEGYLSKMGYDFPARWSKKYFILEENKLFYWKSQQQSKVCVIFCSDFVLLAVVFSRNPKSRF
jgi:hypothetical protein